MFARELHTILSLFAWLKANIAVTLLTFFLLWEGGNLLLSESLGYRCSLAHWHVEEESLTHVACSALEEVLE